MLQNQYISCYMINNFRICLQVKLCFCIKHLTVSVCPFSDANISLSVQSKNNNYEWYFYRFKEFKMLQHVTCSTMSVHLVIWLILAFDCKSSCAFASTKHLTVSVCPCLDAFINAFHPLCKNNTKMDFHQLRILKVIRTQMFE